MKNAQKHKITTSDGQKLAVWHLAPKEDTKKHILLIHGTFSNRSAFTGLVQYLLSHGYQCWVLEWRGHGESETSKEPYDMETVARYDIPAVFDFLTSKGVKRVDCVTHSGGGLSLAIFLTESFAEHKLINSITMFACQAFGSDQRKRNYIKVFLGKYVSKALGYVPGKFAGVVGENESFYMMEQWFAWNLSGRFISREGENIAEKMAQVKIPVFAICAEGDTHIAPPSGCLAFLNCFQNPKNKYLVCGETTGFSENFNHSRILQSRNAKTEVWPIVLDWIGQNHDQ